MSFFTCVVTILKSVNIQFEDEEAVRKAFQEQFGAEGDRFGLEDQEDEAPNTRLQLERVARLLDCKVRVSAEVSPSAQPPATINLARLSKSAGVIIPAGTQQGWARWKSSATKTFRAPRPAYSRKEVRISDKGVEEAFQEPRNFRRGHSHPGREVSLREGERDLHHRPGIIHNSKGVQKLHGGKAKFLFLRRKLGRQQ